MNNKKCDKMIALFDTLIIEQELKQQHLLNNNKCGGSYLTQDWMHMCAPVKICKKKFYT